MDRHPEGSAGVKTRLALTLAAGAALAWPAAAETIHPPATLAERALDGILKHADSDGQQLDNLFGGRGQKNFHATADYGKVLTPPLIAAITAKQKAVVQADCGGQYKKGELCGMDSSPITCAQDFSDSYLYRTDSSSDDRAEITYYWPGTRQPVAAYRLIRQGETWKIDGIRCTDGDAFNFGKS
jgi:hypothetical protein